jgi:hypothetical protein
MKELEKMTKKELIDYIKEITKKKKDTNIPIALSSEVYDASKVYKDRKIDPSHGKYGAKLKNEEKEKWK